MTPLETTLSRRVARDGLLRGIRETAGEINVPVWLVGGYVRDAALGGKSHDIDLLSGKGTARLVRRLQAAWNSEGFRFRRGGVTTWRFSVAGRPVDLVDAERRGLRKDLERRDLTINAIAFDLRRGSIEDPLGGLRDLDSRRLRLPAPGVLDDDPIRALRVVRFMAQLPGFEVGPAVRRAARSVAPRLRRAPVERVRAELDKLLVADAPRRGLEALREFGLLDPLLPELVPLVDCLAGRDRPNVWRHTIDAIEMTGQAGRRRLPGREAMRDPESRRLLRWALLLHDISKPETLQFSDSDGRPTFHGHEVLGARRAEMLLARLRLPRRERRRICRLVSMHLRPGHLSDAGPTGRGLRRLAREAAEDLPLLVVHSACDALASGSPDPAPRFRRLKRVLGQLLETRAALGETPPPPLVGGAEIMRLLKLPSGPAVGRFLAALREEQEAGRVRTHRAAVAFLKSLTG